MDQVLGILGGSGLYDIDGLKNPTRISVDSPWGKPSDSFIIGELNGIRVVFLSRHGTGHYYSPNEVNYRANIDAFKRLGVTDIISLSACGSLKEDLAPGMFVLVDQFIDRTTSRVRSFFGAGHVAHVSIAKPTCNRLSHLVHEVLSESDIPHTTSGTYLAMEGPQFSTYAESMLYRSWGCDVIGMTNMPEARLAREAEICYQTVAMVTDFDCWHPTHGHVDVQAVLQVLNSNSEKGKALIKSLTTKLSAKKEPCSEGCDRALDLALMTRPDLRDPELSGKLDAVLARVLKKC